MGKPVYICRECGDIFYVDKMGEYYCDWIDCESDDPLEYAGETDKDSEKSHQCN
ncbi:hypothetical protein [Metabacillus litoralis]|uniref:hypothetical protein n=1 Tax=Metabacillus litoralis TaxID=152268 RepID=UPI00203F9C36|nr:hypothetical protein [Metabacillus litoralis]MCM3413547.1 hypothetical protein [Metabacillus litoralis]